MDEDLQVKPTLRERLLYDLPTDAVLIGIVMLAAVSTAVLFVLITKYPVAAAAIAGSGAILGLVRRINRRGLREREPEPLVRRGLSSAPPRP
jgi:hypothetical protein